METRIELKQGWKILQDVHDTGEKIGLYAAREADTSVGSQVSEWEELEELKHRIQSYTGLQMSKINRKEQAELIIKETNSRGRRCGGTGRCNGSIFGADGDQSDSRQEKVCGRGRGDEGP